MSLALKCRLLPSKAKHKRLIELVEGQRLLYKAALEERIDCCRKTGKSPAHFDQTKALTECRRELSEMNGIPAQLQRGTLKRLDEACKQFYRRVKRGEKPSFPRFKGRGWFDTLEFAEFSGITVRRQASALEGIWFRSCRHAPPMQDDIKSCKIIRDGRNRHVCFQADVEAPPRKVVRSAERTRIGSRQR